MRGGGRVYAVLVPVAFLPSRLRLCRNVSPSMSYTRSIATAYRDDGRRRLGAGSLIPATKDIRPTPRYESLDIVYGFS